MSNDLKERAAALTVVAFNSNLKKHGRRLRGARRAECLQAAHLRVQEALERFDERKATLSTFVGYHVDGAIKDEIQRQRSGVIGTGRGKSYAPVSLDTLGAATPGKDDPKFGRDADPDSPFAKIYDAQPVTAPGAAFDAHAITREASIADALDRDRKQAPAAFRRAGQEQWCLYWEIVGAQALARDLFTPAGREIISATGTAHFFEAVRWLRGRYPHASDDEIADAALHEAINKGSAELAAFERVSLDRMRQRAAQETERLRKAAHTISELWFPYAGLRKRQGPIRRFRADLHAFLADMPPERAAEIAKAFPAALVRRTELFGKPTR